MFTVHCWLKGGACAEVLLLSRWALFIINPGDSSSFQNQPKPVLCAYFGLCRELRGSESLPLSTTASRFIVVKTTSAFSSFLFFYDILCDSVWPGGGGGKGQSDTASVVTLLCCCCCCCAFVAALPLSCLRAASHAEAEAAPPPPAVI